MTLHQEVHVNFGAEKEQSVPESEWEGISPFTSGVTVVV
jgi:hypothetical protein